MLRRHDYDVVKYVKGEDCVGRYLVLFRPFAPDLMDAMSRAQAQAPGANFMTNRHLTIVEEFTVPLLYHRVCLTIEGDAIHLHTAADAGP